MVLVFQYLWIFILYLKCVKKLEIIVLPIMKPLQKNPWTITLISYIIILIGICREYSELSKSNKICGCYIFKLLFVVVVNIF